MKLENHIINYLEDLIYIKCFCGNKIDEIKNKFYFFNEFDVSVDWSVIQNTYNEMYMESIKKINHFNICLLKNKKIELLYKDLEFLAKLKFILNECETRYNEITQEIFDIITE